jgi:hypothetical protein
MGAIEDLFRQAVTPAQSGGSSALSTLTSLAQIKAMQEAQQRTGGLGGGGGITPSGAPVNVGDYQNWAEQYGGKGLTSDLLVALKQGSYPATGGALYVRPDVAAAFRTASRAFHQDTGDWLKQYLVSAWRPFQSASPLATDMKNSDHWLAGAVDLSAGSAADMWMRSHGAQYGFDPRYSGFNWGDPGHFSFSAGGFYGSGGSSGDVWGNPTGADNRWLELARQWFGV